MAAQELVAEIPIDSGAAVVYEHGWQTTSPSSTYGVTERPHRPASIRNRFIGYRPGRRAPADAFQGEGLLALQAAPGEAVHVFAAADGRSTIPSIRARLRDGRLAVSADGPVEHLVERIETNEAGERSPQVTANRATDVQCALARWAGRFAATMGVDEIRVAPTVWCSWYQYFDAVTEADVAENIDAIERLDLPVEVVQVDDGWQEGIGDWQPAERFGSISAVVARAHGAGMRAGIWIAPFLVSASSQLATNHPDWLVGKRGQPAWIGRNWDDDLYALDSTDPVAWAGVLAALRRLRDLGFDYFKLDFLYAGAIEGRRHDRVEALQAYRTAMGSIREVVGDDCYVLGCGPILPSVGLVDAMRISPDVAIDFEPGAGDLSQPSIRSAMLTARGRAFLHGRLFVNDPDCLIARPSAPSRELWAEHVARWGGLRASSDRLADLDAWGLDATRRLLGEPAPAVLVEG